MCKLVEIGPAQCLADRILVLYAGAVIGGVEVGFGRIFELGFEGLPGVAHDDEVLAIDDRDMGVVGKAHGWVSSFLIRWRFQRVRPE